MLLQGDVGGRRSIGATVILSYLGVGDAVYKRDFSVATVSLPHFITDIPTDQITMASSQYPQSTSSSVTLAEAASTHPTEPHKLQDPIKTQDLEASRSNGHTEAPSTSDKAPLSTIRRHVLLALFAMVGDSYNIGLC